MKLKVFIATSMDGYIADKEGKIDWLHQIPNPDQIDMGYSEFMNQVDAIIMGRNTYETVLNFDMDWPYTKPVYVLSNSLKEINPKAKGKAELIKGEPGTILHQLNEKGFKEIYIDGGKTIQTFLNENLIDELTLTTIPVILGDGIPLFGKSDTSNKFKCISTKLYLDSVVQSKFVKE